MKTMEQREIKFRYVLKNKNTDQISFKWFTLSHIEISGLHDLFLIWTNYTILSRDRYTGLKDKHGKGEEVYERDLFECVYSNVPNGYSPLGHKKRVETYIAEVVFHFGSFAIKVFHPDHGKKVFIGLRGFLENEEKVIIGNIYQDSKLLEK